MDNILPFTSPHDAQIDLANKARALRLQHNYSRKTLAKRSGVAEASIKRFENSGDISLNSLLKISQALGCIESFNPAFKPLPIIDLREFNATPRERGRQ
jgi:transcriptional regulator with XRE-family HTH domain